MTEKQAALIEYFQKFPSIGVEMPNFDSMKNGIAIVALFQYFHGDPINITAIKAAVDGNKWYDKYKEIRQVSATLENCLKDSPYATQKVDVTAIARREDLAAVESFLTHIAYYSFKSKKQEALNALKQCSKPTQNAFKLILKPDLASTPSTQTTQNTTAAAPTVSNEILEGLQAKIQQITSQNKQLQEENEKLKSEINSLKEQQEIEHQSENLENPEEELAKLVQQKAKIQAGIFVSEQSKKTKLNRRQKLLEDKNRIDVLNENLAKTSQEIKDLQQQLEGNESKGPDYSILYDRLQELRADPRGKEISDLNEEKTKCLKKLSKLHKKQKALQAKLDGQQSVAVLEHRKRFLQTLEEANIKRKQRAQIYLASEQKRMRIEAFMQEMRSFV